MFSETAKKGANNVLLNVIEPFIINSASVIMRLILNTDIINSAFYLTKKRRHN